MMFKFASFFSPNGCVMVCPKWKKRSLQCDRLPIAADLSSRATGSLQMSCQFQNRHHRQCEVLRLLQLRLECPSFPPRSALRVLWSETPITHAFACRVTANRTIKSPYANLSKFWTSAACKQRQRTDAASSLRLSCDIVGFSQSFPRTSMRIISHKV